MRFALYCPGLECKRAYEHKIRKRQPIRKIKCRICANEFDAVGSWRKYCSPKCNYQANLDRKSKKPKVKSCKFCTKQFSPYNSLDKFCSAECRINHQKSKRSFTRPNAAKSIMGENNPAYRNGMYTRATKRQFIGQKLFMRNRDEIREAMIAEYGYQFCEHCKT